MHIYSNLITIVITINRFENNYNEIKTLKSLREFRSCSELYYICGHLETIMAEKPRKRVSIIEAPRRKELEAEQTGSDSSSVDFSKGPRIGCRHIQAVLLCFGIMFGIATRTNLSVAIVAMTDNTTSSSDVKTYDWNNTSVILSSFFWSYILLQVLAGFLGKAYGPKYFLLCTYFMNCCACALIPSAASWLGSTGVIICRIIQGFCQSFLYPSTHVLLGTWVPVNERSTLNNFIFSGAAMGTILSSLLTGYISASHLGWPFSFYILASMGGIWCILWALFGQNSPATHPSITKEEQMYIQNSLRQVDDVYLPTPWKDIFTCVPVYALIMAYVGNTWGYAILMTETPTYLSKIMDFGVKSNGVITALPTIMSFVTALITGPLADWLITQNYLSVLKTRRMFQGIGAYGQALCLIWLGFLTKSQAQLSVLVLGLSNALTALTLAGAQVNHLDLSPRFGGVIFGLLNASGQASSIVAPLVAQWVITDPKNVSQWRTIYIISAAMHLIGGTVFLLLSSATRQSWDGLSNKDLQKVKKISVVSLTV